MKSMMLHTLGDLGSDIGTKEHSLVPALQAKSLVAQTQLPSTQIPSTIRAKGPRLKLNWYMKEIPPTNDSRLEKSAKVPEGEHLKLKVLTLEDYKLWLETQPSPSTETPSPSKF
jgi:hypothetical protein